MSKRYKSYMLRTIQDHIKRIPGAKVYDAGQVSDQGAKVSRTKVHDTGQGFGNLAVQELSEPKLTSAPIELRSSRDCRS